MEENEYKYLVNPFNIVDVVDSDVHRSHGPNDPETVTIFFSRNNLRELNTFSRMVLDDDILFTLPGYEILFNIIDHSNPDLPVYSIILEATDIDVSSAKSLREICSCDEYDALRGSYDGTKITAERNDDGSVTFSVSAVQGVRVQQTVKSAPMSVFANLEEEVDVGKMQAKEALNLDIIYVKVRRTDKSMAFLKKVYMDHRSGKSKYFFDVGNNIHGYYNIEELEFDEKSIKLELKKSPMSIKHRTVQHAVDHDGRKKALDDCINRVRRELELRKKLQNGMLTYDREDAMPKGITDVELRPNGEIYAKVNGKDEVEKLRKCLTDDYWGSIQEHWNNYWNLDIHKPCYDGFMQPIGGNEKVQSPQLHRARLNKPKSI